MIRNCLNSSKGDSSIPSHPSQQLAEPPYRPGTRPWGRRSRGLCVDSPYQSCDLLPFRNEVVSGTLAATAPLGCRQGEQGRAGQIAVLRQTAQRQRGYLLRDLPPTLMDTSGVLSLPVDQGAERSGVIRNAGIDDLIEERVPRNTPPFGPGFSCMVVYGPWPWCGPLM